MKNYTKTYKSRKNARNIRKIRINTRENPTEKIHVKEGKKSAKIIQAENCYISEPRSRLGLTRLADFDKFNNLSFLIIKKNITVGSLCSKLRGEARC